MKITIDIDPSILQKMMGEKPPKKRKRSKICQAKKDNKDGEDYLTDSKVWNSGHEPMSWRNEQEDNWI